MMRQTVFSGFAFSGLQSVVDWMLIKAWSEFPSLQDYI